jgi:hypothetical protein
MLNEDTARGLRRLNAVVGLVFAVQAAAILALADDAKLPVTASFLTGPPGSGESTAPDQLFEVPFGPAVAAFLLLAAIDHLLVAGPARGWYERNLAAGVNPARWYEYSISASLMIVLIAMLAGIWDLAALIALFGVNAAMVLFGLVMERVNGPDEDNPDRRPFLYGCIAGAVPWIAIGAQIVLADSNGEGVPTFVVAIFISLFVLFNCFAINMALQYRRVGRWRSYLFGERAYIFISLTAKSVLAWQVYAGALAG